MHTNGKIITGVDFSPGSVAALTQAVRIAIAGGTELELFHSVPRLVVTDLAKSLGRSAPELEAELVSDARQQLQQLLPSDIDPERVAIKVVVGTPLDEILKEVSHQEPHLLVLGVTGSSGSAQGAGTLATKCIRKAKSNVLLVHEQHSGPFRTVVVCVDFSDTSKRALAEAVCLARRDNSDLHILHVYYGPWHTLHYRSPTPEADPAFQRQYINRLQRLLEGFVDQFSAELDGVRYQNCLHEHQSYGRGIVEYAKEHDAELIVLGTLGKTNLSYMVLGSTAERVLRETPCSVLTMRTSRESER